MQVTADFKVEIAPGTLRGFSMLFKRLSEAFAGSLELLQQDILYVGIPLSLLLKLPCDQLSHMGW